MPKLFVASGIFHPESGGPATYLRALLPALQACGWEARALTFGDPQPGDYPYPVTRIAREAYPIRQLKYALASVRHLTWADIVYAHTIDLPLWAGARRPRVIKIVGDQAWERCIRRGWIPPDMSIDDFQQYPGDARARWQKRSRARQVAAMDAVIVPSQYLKRLVLGWGLAEHKIHVIYNALPPADAPTEARAEVREALGWSDQPTLITVARLQPWKGIDHLIAAVGELPDLRLVIVGAGPESERLRAQAAPLGERVRFCGRQPHAQVQRMLYAADALALYSAYEGLSHTILESLQLGTPVLCSDIGGNPEVVRPDVNGILVPRHDPAALRAGIRQVLEKSAELAAGSRTGLERFSFDTMIRRTDALLRSQL